MLLRKVFALNKCRAVCGEFFTPKLAEAGDAARNGKEQGGVEIK